MKHPPIVYIGRYASDIEGDAFFSGAIVSHGHTTTQSKRFAYSEDHRRFVDTDEDLEEKAVYVHDIMNRFVQSDNKTRFMFYAQNYLNELLPNVARDRFVCLNDPWINELLDSKVFTRQWFANYSDTLPYITTTLTSVDYDQLSNALGTNRWLIQNDTGRGGSGSYLIQSRADLEKASEEAREHESLLRRMMITPFIDDATHINQTAIIFPNTIICFQPSLELIQIEKNRLFYSGADYSGYLYEYRNTSFDRSFSEATQKIAITIQKTGYRGIIGFDYLLHDGRIYFIEVNPRFQGSSPALSSALRDAGHLGLYELNYQSFNGSCPDVIKSSGIELCNVDLTVKYQYASTKTNRDQPSSIDGFDLALDYISPNVRCGVLIM